MRLESPFVPLPQDHTNRRNGICSSSSRKHRFKRSRSLNNVSRASIHSHMSKQLYHGIRQLACESYQTIIHSKASYKSTYANNYIYEAPKFTPPHTPINIGRPDSHNIKSLVGRTCLRDSILCIPIDIDLSESTHCEDWEMSIDL